MTSIVKNCNCICDGVFDEFRPVKAVTDIMVAIDLDVARLHYWTVLMVKEVAGNSFEGTEFYGRGYWSIASETGDSIDKGRSV